MEQDELITPREVLEILTFVSYHGLYHGCKGTNALTRFKAGRSTLYSRNEVNAFMQKIIAQGHTSKEAVRLSRRQIPAELV